MTQTQTLQPTSASWPQQTRVATNPAHTTAAAAALDGISRREKALSSNFYVKSIFAGGLAGCCAKTVIAPLDRIKILFQTGNPQFKQYAGSVKGMGRGLLEIWRTSGVYGLFQGHTATLLRVFPYAAIKFVVYDHIRDHLIPSKQHEIWYRRIAAGSLAGLTSVFFTYPLELIRVRLAFETKENTRTSFRTICSRIYHERDLPIRKNSAVSDTAATVHHRPPLSGLANFYRGFIPTIAGMIPYAGVSFWAHDFVGDILRSRPFAPYTLSPVPPRNEREVRHPKLKHQWEAVDGGIAGAVAQTSSYPIEVIRRRMQVSGAIGNREMKGFWQTAKSIYASGGFKGFYVGLSIGYIKVVPMVSCSFVVWEQMKHWLDLN